MNILDISQLTTILSVQQCITEFRVITPTLVYVRIIPAYFPDHPHSIAPSIQQTMLAQIAYSFGGGPIQAHWDTSMLVIVYKERIKIVIKDIDTLWYIYNLIGVDRLNLIRSFVKIAEFLSTTYLELLKVKDDTGSYP